MRIKTEEKNEMILRLTQKDLNKLNRESSNLKEPTKIHYIHKYRGAHHYKLHPKGITFHKRGSDEGAAILGVFEEGVKDIWGGYDSEKDNLLAVLVSGDPFVLSDAYSQLNDLLGDSNGN
ncbi:MAG: hypothetical protein PVJ67_01750 [Candidatus Pacearchaeota archaeon]|jgi:hypothetical protein